MLRHALILCAFWSWLALGAVEANVDAAAITADATTLINLGDRSPGSPGHEAAALLIEARLRTLGLEPLRVRTTVTVSRDDGCQLVAGDATLRLVPHRANRAAPAGTAGETLRGTLLDLGHGTPDELRGKDLVGAIVVLDGDSGSAWTTVAQLGAAAVIFRDPARINRRQLALQSLNVSVDYPRLVAAEAIPASAFGTSVELTATVRQVPATALSIVARIPGHGDHREAVLVTTGYESPSALAGLSPGATRAWNAAAQLDLCRILASSLTARDVLVVFHAGDDELLRGLRHLTAALMLDRTADGFAPTAQLDELHRALQMQVWRDQAVRAAATNAPSDLATLCVACGEQLSTAPLPDINLADEKLLAGKRAMEFIALVAGRQADALQPGVDRLREGLAPRIRKTLDEAELQRRQSILADADAAYMRYRTLQQKLAYETALAKDEETLIAELAASAGPELDLHLATITRQRDDYASLVAARQVLAGATPIHVIGLDLSDGAPRFAAAIKGVYQTWLNELGWLPSGLVKLADDLNHQGGVPIPFERAAHDAQDEAGAWFGSDYLHDAGVAGLYLPGATLSTVPDARLRQGSPADDAAHFGSQRFLAQVPGMARCVVAWIDAGFIADRKPKDVAQKTVRVEVEVRSLGTKTGYRGYTYPLVYVQPDSIAATVPQCETWWGDAFGMVRIPFVVERHPDDMWNGLNLTVYGYDTEGRISAVPADGGVMRRADSLKLGASNSTVSDVLPLVFACHASRLFDVFDPRLLTPLADVSVLSASRESAPTFAHVEVSRELPVAAIFSEPGTPLRITATQGKVGNRLVLTGHAAQTRAGETDPRRIAAGLGGSQLSRSTALDTAEDFFRLNDERLSLLRRTGINPDSQVTMHALAERHLAKAREATTARDYDAARGAAESAWAIAGRVYPQVLGTANDVVYGLVVMLLFSIPFAWVCERLFISAATIVGKVAGFGACFVATFLFFYLFHPAFELATTPMVIFLAFIIIIMSTWVISLLYNRFEFEMERIRMGGLGVHKADVSRLGTLVATVALGISNMRRRPIRTGLTGLTVVLMTFILLTFASFNPSTGSQRLGLDGAPPYQGILVRQSGWLDLPEPALERIRRVAGTRLDTHAVRWLAPSSNAPRYPLTTAQATAEVIGVLGIEAGDPTGAEDCLIRGAESDANAPRGLVTGERWLFLPTEVLKRLKATPGDEVRLRGLDFRAGTLDTRRLGGLQQLGGEPVTPLAYDATDQRTKDDGARLAALASESGSSEDSSSVTYLSPASVAVAAAADLEILGGGLRAVALTAHSRDIDISQTAEELARELAVTLRVGDSGESWLLTSIGKMSVAGLGAVLIPLILGGLIIFSTMLNSVAERGKEIFIFASLGLAPVHVAALFLVEAAIYAVLGGLGGYMLAQLLVSGLGFAADHGFGTRPDINYSSFTAVATIMLVMATVLLSALYPARVASAAANPGTTDFRVPDPDGDRLAIDFPFTVAARDVRGLCAFLSRYFDTHTESAGGCFTAADAAMAADGERFQVGAKVWLAPFDLGISQRFVMSCRPTDVRAIYAVKIDLELLSGQRAAWRRTNLAFLKDLRQQFLVWRTLTPETMDQYRADGGDEAAKQRLKEYLERTTSSSASLPVARSGA